MTKNVVVCAATALILSGCPADEPFEEGWEGGTVGGYETPEMPGVAALTDPNEIRPLTQVVGHVQRRGPWDYREDGEIYENLQKRLPEKPRGYYREFTVPTPNVNGRGARRLVAGENGELYYWRPEKIEFLPLHLPPGTPPG